MGHLDVLGFTHAGNSPFSPPTTVNDTQVQVHILATLKGTFANCRDARSCRSPEMTQLLVLQYAQRALLINEFTDHRWQTRVYPGTGQYAGQNLGNGILSQFGFPRGSLFSSHS